MCRRLTKRPRSRETAQQRDRAVEKPRRYRCCPNVTLRDLKSAALGAGTVSALAYLTWPSSQHHRALIGPTVELCVQQSPSLPVIDHRGGLADILVEENKTKGLEVGVKQGHFAAQMLSK